MFAELECFFPSSTFQFIAGRFRDARIRPCLRCSPLCRAHPRFNLHFDCNHPLVHVNFKTEFLFPSHRALAVSAPCTSACSQATPPPSLMLCACPPNRVYVFMIVIPHLLSLCTLISSSTLETEFPFLHFRGYSYTFHIYSHHQLSKLSFRIYSYTFHIYSHHQPVHATSPSRGAAARTLRLDARSFHPLSFRQVASLVIVTEAPSKFGCSYKMICRPEGTRNDDMESFGRPIWFML
jgi:hypothetical protein